MTEYKPPLNDIRLVLNEISDISRLCDLPGYEHVDVETIDGVLEELGRFAAEVVSPVNKIGESSFDRADFESRFNEHKQVTKTEHHTS